MLDLSEISEEDQTQLIYTLKQWKKDGTESPLIAVDFDLDGDGTTDSFGLDENDNLVVVSGVKMEATVSVSTGESEVTS